MSSPHSDWRSDSDFWVRPEDLPQRPRRLPFGIYGNARLANRRDLFEFLALPEEDALILPDATLIVEEKKDGSTLQALLHQGLHLPAHVRERHVLAVGTTGCGKTQKLILPALAADLADPARTVIALDAKGGVLPGFMTALVKRLRPEQRVHVVNFKSPARATHVWNPVQHIATRQEALEIAHAVCSNVDVHSGEARMNEAFWLFSSVNLLADVLRLLADDPAEQASLARAKQIIDDSAGGMARLGDNHPYSSEFDTRYPALRRYIDGSSNVTQQSVVADCAMRMTLFADEAVACTTSGANELDLRQLVREGGVLVLEVPEAHSKQLMPLTNLFVTRLLTALLDESLASPSGRLPRPCSVVLDELGSACGRLPDFETRLATLRSRGVSITGAVQSLRQLEHLYGPTAGVLDGFSTKVFFGGSLSLQDAKYVSESAGTCTVAVESRTWTKTEDGSKTQGRSLTAAPRPVLLPDEAMRPPVHPLLGPPLTIFAPTAPPFFAYLVPAYERPDLSMCLREGMQFEGELAARPMKSPRVQDPPPRIGRTSLTQRVESNSVYLVRGKSGGREAWYYVRVNKKPKVLFEKDASGGSMNLADYGEILLSGWGKDPPPDAVQRARDEWGFQGE